MAAVVDKMSRAETLSQDSLSPLQLPPRLTRANAMLQAGTSILIDNAVERAKTRGVKVAAVETDWKWWARETEETSEFQANWISHM